MLPPLMVGAWSRALGDSTQPAHALAQPTFSSALSPGHAIGAVGASGEPEEAFWPSSLISNGSGARSTDDIGDLY